MSAFCFFSKCLTLTLKDETQLTFSSSFPSFYTVDLTQNKVTHFFDEEFMFYFKFLLITMYHELMIFNNFEMTN